MRRQLSTTRAEYLWTTFLVLVFFLAVLGGCPPARAQEQEPAPGQSWTWLCILVEGEALSKGLEDTLIRRASKVHGLRTSLCVDEDPLRPPEGMGVLALRADLHSMTLQVVKGDLFFQAGPWGKPASFTYRVPISPMPRQALLPAIRDRAAGLFDQFLLTYFNHYAWERAE